MTTPTLTPELREKIDNAVYVAGRCKALAAEVPPFVRDILADAARELLRIVPADDGELIDDKILIEEFGFRPDGMHLARHKWGAKRNGTMQVYPFWNGAKGEWFVNGSQITIPKTRGEVRRLFAALGIPSPGPAGG